jgi:hypothetical protein
MYMYKTSRTEHFFIVLLKIRERLYTAAPIISVLIQYSVESRLLFSRVAGNILWCWLPSEARSVAVGLTGDGLVAVARGTDSGRRLLSEWCWKIVKNTCVEFRSLGLSSLSPPGCRRVVVVGSHVLRT